MNRPKACAVRCDADSSSTNFQPTLHLQTDVPRLSQPDRRLKQPLPRHAAAVRSIGRLETAQLARHADRQTAKERRPAIASEHLRMRARRRRLAKVKAERRLAARLARRRIARAQLDVRRPRHHEAAAADAARERVAAPSAGREHQRACARHADAERRGDRSVRRRAVVREHIDADLRAFADLGRDGAVPTSRRVRRIPQAGLGTRQLPPVIDAACPSSGMGAAQQRTDAACASSAGALRRGR